MEKGLKLGLILTTEKQGLIFCKRQDRDFPQASAHFQIFTGREVSLCHHAQMTRDCAEVIQAQLHVDLHWHG